LIVRWPRRTNRREGREEVVKGCFRIQMMKMKRSSRLVRSLLISRLIIRFFIMINSRDSRLMLTILKQLSS